MRKRFLAVVLLILMLGTTLFSSCDKTATLQIKTIPVFTLYGITGETTTPDAVRSVELALNRILINRYDVAVKLMLFPENEYDDAIQQAIKDYEDYEQKKADEASALKESQKNNPDKKKDDKNTSAESGSTGSTSGLTGDEIIELLENNEDIPLDVPRFDIFLVQGYQDYYDFIDDGMLMSIDTQLTSDVKVLLQYIHASFINPTSTAISGARYEGKTYGIPNNGPIGEYEYLVFDKELMDKYGYDAPAMKDFEDFEPFLKDLKDNEPDVVPLTGTTTPKSFEYLISDGFPVSVDNDGFLFGTYLNDDVKAFYQTINNYRSLGYLPQGEYDGTSRFGVSIIKGNESDIEALEAKTGREYYSVVYKTPVATAENLLQNIFCVSKYCGSDLPKALNILRLINTDVEARNIFLYGIENINYKFDDNNQVVMLNDDYSMKCEETGNQFLTYTMAGEDPNKWEKAKEQNLESVISPSISFKYEQQELKPDEPSGEESGSDTSSDAAESTDSEVVAPPEESTVAPPDDDDDDDKDVPKEPDYQKIFQDIVDKYYDDLKNGTGNFEEIWTSIQTELEAEGYVDALVNSFLPQFKKAVPTYPTEDSPYDYMQVADEDTSAAA